MMFHHDKLNPIQWHEGMLLEPKHLYQQTHFLENLAGFSLHYFRHSHGLLQHPEFTHKFSITNCPNYVKIAISGYLGITQGGDLIAIPNDKEVVGSQLLEPRDYLVCIRINYEKQFSHNPEQNFTARYELNLIYEKTDIKNTDIIVAEIKYSEISKGHILNQDYIPPCFCIASDERLVAKLKDICDKIWEIQSITARILEEENDVEISHFFFPIISALSHLSYFPSNFSLSPQNFVLNMLRCLKNIEIMFLLKMSPFKELGKELQAKILILQRFVDHQHSDLSNIYESPNYIFSQLYDFFLSLEKRFQIFLNAREPANPIILDKITYERITVNSIICNEKDDERLYTLSQFANRILNQKVLIIFKYSYTYQDFLNWQIRIGSNQNNYLYNNTALIQKEHKISEQQLGTNRYVGILLIPLLPVDITGIGILLKRDIRLEKFLVYVQKL